MSQRHVRDSRRHKRTDNYFRSLAQKFQEGHVIEPPENVQSVDERNEEVSNAPPLEVVIEA